MVCFFALAAGCVGTAATAIKQPLPFSHKEHSGELKQECRLCHVNPDPGKFEGMPDAASCMNCHSNPKVDTPAIRQLAAYARKHRNIPWVRVSSIPDFVLFNHRKHIAAGASCQDCHGDVSESDEMTARTDFKQQDCLQCHRAKKISTECGFCHDLG